MKNGSEEANRTKREFGVAEISSPGPEPVRIQRKRTKGWKMPANTVSVTRPGPWGNYAGTTKQSFVEDLANMSNADKAFFMDKIAVLRGKNLACWCSLDQPCHGDMLLELANSQESQP